MEAAIETEEVKQREDLLDGIDEDSDLYTSIHDLDLFMKSFEEEITTSPASGHESGAAEEGIVESASDCGEFVGNLILNEETHSLTPAQILLRDSKLWNTEFAYRAVIFSCRDTKAVGNSTRSPSKRSRVERKMDRVIYLLFGVMVFISLTAVGSAVFTMKSDAERWYLRLHGGDDGLFAPDRVVLSGFLQFVNALMLYHFG